MKLNRRSFFAALAAVPAVAKVAPKVKAQKAYRFAYTIVPAPDFSPELIEWMRVCQEREKRMIRDMLDASFYEDGQ